MTRPPISGDLHNIDDIMRLIEWIEAADPDREGYTGTALDLSLPPCGFASDGLTLRLGSLAHELLERYSIKVGYVPITTRRSGLN